MALAVVLGILLALAISWMKPLLGYSGIVGIVIGVVIIAISAFLVHAIQISHAYFVAYKHSTPRYVRSYSVRILSLAVPALIPLTVLCAAEYLGPDDGIVRSIVKACGFDDSLEPKRKPPSGDAQQNTKKAEESISQSMTKEDFIAKIDSLGNPCEKETFLRVIGKPERTQTIDGILEGVYWYYTCKDGTVQIIFFNPKYGVGQHNDESLLYVNEINDY